MDLLLTNIGVLATPLGSAARCGPAQRDILLLENAAVGVSGGRIAYVGPAAGAPVAAVVEDCENKLLTPGLVDAHTHLVFGGWRQHEMAKRLAGVSYLDILRQGGGILSTVVATRAADEETLYQKGRGLMAQMLRHGTTTCECKSGYGLTVQDEIKQLRVAKRLAKAGEIGVVSTFLGAHALPAEYKENRQAYVDLICDEMLPLVAEGQLAEFCDVFCETGVFTVQESAEILRRANELGLRGKAHVDEIDPLGGAQMAAALGCISAEHLIQTSDEGIEALAQSGTVACLLPGTSFYLHKPYARARAMIQAGVPVAIATDFNPGSSPNLSLQFPMNLACLRYGMAPAEALTAVTLNAAAAIGQANAIGSIETGKAADLVLWDAPDLDYIFYRYGSNLVQAVVRGGKLHSFCRGA